MSTIAASLANVDTTGRWARVGAWAGVAGAALFVVGEYVVLGNVPDMRGDQAVTKLTDLLNDPGKRNVVMIGEFAALAGGALILWFATRLYATLRVADETPARKSVASALGLGGFAILAMLSLILQTTMAGTAAFSPAFEPDPHTAMVFAHLGYVVMAGAMMCAAVALAAASGLIRSGTTVLPARLGTAGRVVAVLAVVSFVFVYGGLLLVSIWTAVAALNTRHP